MRADPTGVRHVALPATDSTNAEALRRAREGEAGPLWVSAETQSAGRGRGGNAWVSEPGNLYATLLLRQPASPSVAPQLAFVAGLAVHDAVAACAQNLGPVLQLKWPNDLLCNGRKLAGLLIEAENTPVFAVAIGVGINCVSHPDNASYPATDLKSEAARVTAVALFAALAEAMGSRLTQWARGEGFASVRADWLKRAAGLGEPIKVRLPDRQLAGRFGGVDDTGRLLLETAGKIETITAGEVFSLGAA
jgi:BirA family transcriptional regulator, biotin operon repressor / biotin---[acetyl-CoA-carboxylase] ligase